MELLISLAIVTTIVVTLGAIIIDSFKDHGTTDWTPILIIILISNMIVIPCLIHSLKKPRAIDVYRDRTTLEITYKNSVPLDSVVVWKDK